MAAQEEVIRAASWFSQAAAQGHILATHNLAACYEAGKGVPQDQTEATRFFTLAAQAGHAPSQYRLAWRKYKGVCPPLSRPLLPTCVRLVGLVVQRRLFLT